MRARRNDLSTLKANRADIDTLRGRHLTVAGTVLADNVTVSDTTRTNDLVVTGTITPAVPSGEVGVRASDASGIDISDNAASSVGTYSGGSIAASVVVGGLETHVGGTETVTLGYRAKSTSANNTAVGAQSLADGVYCTAVGHGATAGLSIGSADYSSAFGYNATCDGRRAVAIGANSYAAADCIAIGGGNNLTLSVDVRDGSDRSIGIGRQIIIDGFGTLAIGYAIDAQQDYVVAIGDNAFPEASRGVAIGADANTGGTHCTAIGYQSVAGYLGGGYDYSSAFGAGAKADSNLGVAIGANSYAGTNSIAIGAGLLTSSAANVPYGADDAIAIGHAAQLTSAADRSIALGASTSVAQADSIALGYGAATTAGRSFAIVHSSAVHDTGSPAAPADVQYYWKVRINATDYFIPLYTSV